MGKEGMPQSEVTQSVIETGTFLTVLNYEQTKDPKEPIQYAFSIRKSLGDGVSSLITVRTRKKEVVEFLNEHVGELHGAVLELTGERVLTKTGKAKPNQFIAYSISFAESKPQE